MRNNCIYSFLSLIWTFNQTINERYVQKLETLLFSRVPLLGRRRAAVVTTLYQIWCDTRHGGDRGATPTVAAMPVPWLGASKYCSDNLGTENIGAIDPLPWPWSMVTGGVTAILLVFLLIRPFSCVFYPMSQGSCSWTIQNQWLPWHKLRHWQKIRCKNPELLHDGHGYG